MKIIVAGGTGFLGKKIVSSLANKGHNVCVLTRNLHKHKNTFSNNVNMIDWSTINPSFLSDTNILIKLNGEKVDQLWTKSVKSKILNSRIDSTKMLFDFCVKNEIIPQKFINASAVGIYAKESANYNFSVDENSELGNTFFLKIVGIKLIFSNFKLILFRSFFIAFSLVDLFSKSSNKTITMFFGNFFFKMM